MLVFEAQRDLFENPLPYSKDTLIADILEDAKLKYFTGIPDSKLDISFSVEGGADILIKTVDQEKALGYRVFPDPGSYFEALAVEMHQPTEDEIREALNG